MVNRIIKTECGTFIDLKAIAVIKPLCRDNTYEAILNSGVILNFIDLNLDDDRRQGVRLKHKILTTLWTELILSTSFGFEVE